MAEQDGADKSHEPTPKRLTDARAKGEIARSPDLVTAIAFCGFVLALATIGAGAADTAGLALRSLLEHPDTGASEAVLAALRPLALLMLPPALAVVILLTAQRGVTFTLQNLAPRWSRIDPLAAAARRFGLDGLADFAKGLAKLCLVGAALVWFLAGQGDAVIGSMALAAGPGTLLMLDLLLRFLALCATVSLIVGGADYLWQLRRHMARNRMSRQDLIDEHKEAEGDPQARAARRQRGQDIAMNRMMADIPKADVVIVNPTHYAVALHWNRSAGRAPVCLAKGTDEVALRIRSIALAHGVPIHSDPPTARAIHATVDIGRSIRPEHYRAVAAALRLTAALRRKSKERR